MPPVEVVTVEPMEVETTVVEVETTVPATDAPSDAAEVPRTSVLTTAAPADVVTAAALVTLGPLPTVAPAPTLPPIVEVPALFMSPATGEALAALGLCSADAAVPKLEMPLHTWDLPDATKDVCYKMFIDQPQMTDHGRRSFGRNWCWVLMKRYGCLSHLGDSFTWKEAQTAAASIGGVPEAAVMPFEPLQNPEVCDQRRSVRQSSENWKQADRLDARAWFEKNVAVYVLNLPSEDGRWRNVSARLAELEIGSERIAGFNMTAKEDMAAAYSEGAIPADFNISRAQEEALSPRNAMHGILGSVGCAAGHFRALASAAKAGRKKPVTLILEDDAYLHDDFVPQVWALMQDELPCDWEAVSLGSFCPYGKCISKSLSRVFPDGNEPEWRCRHGVNYGFQGVLYRTEAVERIRAKWQPVVFDEKRPHCLDVDVAMASISDQVSFYAVPSIQALLTERPGEDGSVRTRINREHA